MDTASKDKVISGEYSKDAADRARAQTESFRQFIEDNKDEITALQVLYSQPYGGGLTYTDIRELAEAIGRPPHRWTTGGAVAGLRDPRRLQGQRLRPPSQHRPSQPRPPHPRPDRTNWSPTPTWSTSASRHGSTSNRHWAATSPTNRPPTSTSSRNTSPAASPSRPQQTYRTRPSAPTAASAVPANSSATTSTRC